MRSDRPSSLHWVHVGLAGGLAVLSAAVVVAGAPSLAPHDLEYLEKSASLGADLALAGIAAERAVLQAQCAVLAEDPRIKSTLATEGMDAGSINDILADLNKTAGIQLSAILSKEGRVIASAGESALEGLDLHSSSIFRAARPGASASDSWIFGARLFNVAAIPISSGERVIAFLVLGRVFDESGVHEAARRSQSAALLRIAGKWTSAAVTPEYQAAFDAAAGLSSGPVRSVPNFAGHVAEIGEPSLGARLIFLSKRSMDSDAKRQVTTWTPPGALCAFAVILFLSKLRTRN